MPVHLLQPSCSRTNFEVSFVEIASGMHDIFSKQISTTAKAMPVTSFVEATVATHAPESFVCIFQATVHPKLAWRSRDLAVLEFLEPVCALVLVWNTISAEE